LKKYPSLAEDFAHFIPIANLWKIDLSEAERKHVEGGVCGESDIWIDVVGSIFDWLDSTKEKSLTDFVMENMWNWGYTEFEDWKILKPKIIKKLERGF
jgi:hypothetical protein